MAKLTNLNTSNMEEAKDSLGGFRTFPSDIYTANIKAVYTTQSASGATAVNVVLDIDGNEYRETFWISNSKGECFFTMPNSKNSTKRYPMPGYTMADDLALIAAGCNLTDIDWQEKTFNIYSPADKKAVPTAVPTAVDMLGKKLGVAIALAEENKQKKNAEGVYENTAETVQRNHIVKFFDLASRKTVYEAKNGKDSEFWDNWLNKNKGKVINRVKKIEAPSPQVKPSASLFGNK